MKKRNVRWLLASVVAVVSIGAGVSATASDEAVGEPEQAAWSIKEHQLGRGGPHAYSARSFGIRW